MRKVGYLLLGLFLIFGLGCTKSNDLLKDVETENQFKSAETRSGNWKGVDFYAIPLYCDDQVVDYLSGDLESHWIWHVEDGKYVWLKIIWNGTLTSEFTGEIFKVKEFNKLQNIEGAVYWWQLESYDLHYNIKGDMGSHYIGSGYVDIENGWALVLDRVNCPPNKK
jgi:hypothetical protein